MWTQEDKLQIVLLHLEQNIPTKVLSERFGVNRSLLCVWCKQYVEYGAERLRSQNGIPRVQPTTQKKKEYKMNSTNSDFINGIIGKLIREYREKAGYSQNDLAKKSGLSQQHISQVELGKRNIGSDQLVMLGLLLGFSLYDIQERLNAQPTTASLATIDDYDVVWKLDPYITTDLLTSHIKNDQVYLLWTPDQAVGACRYSLFNLVFPLLDHLYIDEHHRGMRYGTALLEYWENAMKELGYGHVMLSIQESNTARIFFEKFGYQCVGSYSLPFQDCDDLMYMKELE